MLTGFLRDWGARLRDPKNQGNVMLGAGAVLVADGLVGLENPFNGRKTRPGIFGALLGVVIGLIVLLVGVWIGNTTGPIKGGITTTGTVVSVHTSTDAKGRLEYAPVIEFHDATGAPHEFADSISSGSQPSIGNTVKVSYDPEHPDNARNLSNHASLMHWLFVGFGALALVLSFITFVMRLLAIIGGGLLLRWGFERRRQVERGEEPTAGPAAGSLMERVGTWMQTKAEKRAGSDPGELLGVGSPALAAATITASAPPAHTNAPAGWYQDPNDATHKRWWDGSAWGQQVE